MVKSVALYQIAYRKPLILKGVRQVGKTWILKEFGKRYYENTAYFNFDENEEYKQFFETTKDVNRILQNLMLASGQRLCRISAGHCTGKADTTKPPLVLSTSGGFWAYFAFIISNITVRVITISRI